MGRNYNDFGRPGGRGGWQKKSDKKRSNVSASPDHSSPIVGLSKVIFTFGTTNDAAAFLITKSKLARHAAEGDSATELERVCLEREERLMERDP